MEQIAQECMSNADPNVRAAAAAFVLTVGSGGKRAARTLLEEMLADDDREPRAAALVAVVDACPGRFKRALAVALDSADPTERVVALRGIEALPASPAFGTLASALLSDPDDRVRRAAADALRTHPPNLGPLINALDDADWSVRQRAAEALARHAPAAGTALAECRSLRLELMVTIALSEDPSSGALRRARPLLSRALQRRSMLLAARTSIRGRSPAAQILKEALTEACDELWELTLRLVAARTRSKSAGLALRGLDSPDRNQRAIARRIGEQQLSRQLSDLKDPRSDASDGVERLLGDEDPELRLLSAEYLALK
jgi:HEAT repeat protein